MQNKKDLLDIKFQLKTRVLNFLSYKLRTEQEVLQRIERYLNRSEITSRQEKTELRDQIVLELKEHGLVNDELFAETFIKEKMLGPRSSSFAKIKEFLLRKGVSQDIIQQKFKLFPSLEEGNVLREAEKKLKSIKGGDRRIRKQKLIKFLLSKGYRYDAIRSVVDSVVDVK